MTLWTVGHSTRSLEELIELLRSNRIELLADVRTVPGSRRMPQFAKLNLTTALPEAGISYVHMPGLGGLRRPRPDSINSAWRNGSFRGYADYMQTPEFDAALRELMAEAAGQRTAIMCAEAVPWRCHRSLLADALAVRGFEVEHILSARALQAHRLTPFARVEASSVFYPA